MKHHEAVDPCAFSHSTLPVRGLILLFVPPICYFVNQPLGGKNLGGHESFSESFDRVFQARKVPSQKRAWL